MNFHIFFYNFYTIFYILIFIIFYIIFAIRFEEASHAYKEHYQPPAISKDDFVDTKNELDDTKKGVWVNILEYIEFSFSLYKLFLYNL